VICGNCKDRDQTVEHVRACYSGRTIQAAVAAKIGAPAPVLYLADLPVEGIFTGCNDEGAVSYYKVQRSPSTGNWYAKRWDGGEWVYEGRKPLHFLTADDRIDATSAARFGAVTGSCIFCMRTLTDERSIKVGYGPICAGHNGLPWGEN
jgi:hypothetical protein